MEENQLANGPFSTVGFGQRKVVARRKADIYPRLAVKNTQFFSY
jgi:hypothetical protein